MDEHEYVEYVLELKDGQVVSAEFAGEGRQVEPLTKPILLMPVGNLPWPRWLESLERRIQRKLSVLGS